MSTSCITSATGTTTSLLTTNVTTTTFTESLSTALPITTTITSETCILPLGSLTDVPCLSTATTITSTIPASVITTSVPVVATAFTTETDTITLFGSSCTVITSVSSHSSIVSTPDSISFSPSLSTPPPVVITSQSASTLSNGQVSMILETIMSTPPPLTVYVPNPPPTQVAQTNDDGSGSSVRIAPIIGGVVAGFFGLLGIALIIWFIMKRRRRWDDIFDKEDTSKAPGRATKRFSLDDLEIEPKPYQYGLVGQTRSPSAGVSPPNSPPASSSSPSLQPPRHNLPPLLLPTSASTPGPSATTLSSRPSTAGSMRPLRDGPTSPPVSGHKHSHTTSSGSSTSVRISPAMPSNWGHHSPSPSADQGYFERSGSPTSIHEPQVRLQLANIGDDEVTRSPPTPSVLAGPALLDGKGRHVRLGSGGPGVLVHTDAGPAPPDFEP
ncbi:hypothetical protein B0H19DRAFT_1190579 [Mycena capillaripes]|nr:hypothetical protein B0H19DRAFT_1190579 [Mycena capillaripes]